MRFWVFCLFTNLLIGLEYDTCLHYLLDYDDMKRGDVYPPAHHAMWTPSELHHNLAICRKSELHHAVGHCSAVIIGSPAAFHPHQPLSAWEIELTSWECVAHATCNRAPIMSPTWLGYNMALKNCDESRIWPLSGQLPWVMYSNCAWHSWTIGHTMPRTIWVHHCVNHCFFSSKKRGFTPISACDTFPPEVTLFCQASKLVRAKKLLSDTQFMETCSFTTHFKKINACSKALVVWLKTLYASYTCLSMKSVVWMLLLVNNAS